MLCECSGEDLSSIPISSKNRLQESSTHRPWRFCIWLFVFRKQLEWKNWYLGCYVQVQIWCLFRFQQSISCKCTNRQIFRFVMHSIWLLYLCCCSMNGMNIQPQCTKTVNLNLRYCRHRTELTDSSLLRHDYYWTNERNEHCPCAFVLCSTDQSLTYIAVMVANSNLHLHTHIGLYRCSN